MNILNQKIPTSNSYYSFDRNNKYKTGSAAEEILDFNDQKNYSFLCEANLKHQAHASIPDDLLGENLLKTVMRGSLFVLDMGIYKSILNQRNNHDIFEYLSEGFPDILWFCYSKANKVIGPLTFIEMDDMFKNYELDEKTQIWTNNDVNRKTLSRIIKKYYSKKMRSLSIPENSYDGTKLVWNKKIHKNQTFKKFDCNLFTLNSKKLNFHRYDTVDGDTQSEDEDDLRERNRAYTLLC